MFYLILLILGSTLLETYGVFLDCTNDYNKLVSCCFDANNCTSLNLSIYNAEQTAACALDSSRGCCCSMNMTLRMLIADEFSAKVQNIHGESVHSQKFTVFETYQPPCPTIIGQVTPLNGHYQMQWKSNADRIFTEKLSAIMTYQKKDDVIKNSTQTAVSEKREVSTSETDLNYFRIPGRDLEPSTTYVISVKTITDSGVSSESSNIEFTTDPPTEGWLIAGILCLSVVAIFVTGGTFWCFIKLKEKFWDLVEKPKLLNINPKHMILKPEPLLVQSVSVEPLVLKDDLSLSKESLPDSGGGSGQTSDIGTGSSYLDYANTQPIDMEACVLEALKNAFPDMTFSCEEPTQCSVPLPPHETSPSPVVFYNKSYERTTTSPNDGVEEQMPDDSGYHGPPLHDFTSPPHVSAPMETDMSYQPCAQPGIATSDSSTLLPTNYGYQDFEKLVEQSNNISSNEKTGECLPPCLLMPHVSNEMTVDHGYHCV